MRLRTLRELPRREQSRGEEVANALSHGAGLAAALVGAPVLVIRAARHGDAGSVIGAGIFSATAVALYLSSTLYHALPAGTSKRVFRVIEHSAIFLLIAGTYTAFALGTLRGPLGWTLLGIIWSLAAAGIAMKCFDGIPHPALSTGLYLLMGWLVVIAIDPLVAAVPTAGILWMVAGGLSYTVGVVFYSLGSWLRYGHFVWHLFVLGGTVCHYVAVLRYALQPPR